jgi:CubicO group peptidase (beta-lactamase class C family)
MTVRDLLVHRSGLGLGAGDLLWWPASTYNRREIAQRLRYIPLATSFRSAYAYDNVLYLVAGEVIEAVSGQSWEDFVSTRILARVSMTTSNVRHSDAAKGGNVATPHARVDGMVRPIAPFDSDNTNPAGGINSNAEDMAKWMIVQLAEGKLADGSQLMRPATARQLTTIVTPIPIGAGPPELAAARPNFNGYGLGFNVRDYRGRKLLTHTGGLPGYVSRVAMLPGIHLGIAILTNQESGAAFDSIANTIMDGYLGSNDTDWVAAYPAIAKRQAAASAAARDASSKPSLPLDKYAGTYQDAWYGGMTISRIGTVLAIAFDRTPLLTGTLEHWQHDTFVARWKDR